jgi:Gas vesicle synthesis protein GvpL/GvpF
MGQPDRGNGPRWLPDLLGRVLRDLAEEDANELLQDARDRARVRAAKLIEDALVDELLEAVTRLHSEAPRTESAEPLSAPHPRPATPPDSQTPPVRSSQDRLWWAYCVLFAHDSANVPVELDGIEPGTRIQLVHEGEFAALVSSVPGDEYDDVRLREHLEDLDWVERTARRHEQVLDAVLGKVSIVPLRLCTLFRDLSGVRRLLSEHAEALRSSLDLVSGSAEWGVKVFAETAVDAEPAPPEPIAEERGSAGPGAAYLVHRRRERERSERSRELRAKGVAEIHRRVAAGAREAASNPPQRPELHGRNMAMLLNGVYLVADERRQELSETIAALRTEWEPRGLVIELTGPWPAYNFVGGATGVVA